MNPIPLFTSQHNFEVTHVIDLDIPYKEYISIDLSGSNKDLELFDISKSSEWEIYLDSYLKKNGKKVAYGGYMERRALYDRSNYFNKKDKSKQRCIHLG